MSSIINTVYKRPSSVFTLQGGGNDDEKLPTIQSGGLVITCMWIVIAIVAAARTEFSSALAGFFL